MNSFNLENRNTKKISLFLILTVLMTVVFYTNFLSKDNKSFVKNFGQESESLVLGKILADKNKVDSKQFGLGIFTLDEYAYTSEKLMQSYRLIYPNKYYISDNNWTKGISKHWTGFYDLNTKISSELYKKDETIKIAENDYRKIEKVEEYGEYIWIYLSGDLLNPHELKYPVDFKLINIEEGAKKGIFTPYTSQFGMQGQFFSFIYNEMGINNIDLLKLLSIFLLSSTLSFLCLLVKKEYNLIFGTIFYLVFILSPWMAAFAGNLYWVPFTWFLPALFSLLLLKNIKQYYFYLPLIFLSVFIKSLCGYEYLSTILIFTISFWIIEFVLNTRKQRKKIFLFANIIGFLCFLGFFLALLLHANLRNNDTISGLKSIWSQDVLRRTYTTNSAFFDTVYKDSLSATPSEVVIKYFLWNTPIIYGISGKLFSIIFFLSLSILIFNLFKNKKNIKRDWILFIVTFLCPLSWFVLAKAHSYIHTHINFVLWYFGFIQVMFYIIIKFILNNLFNMKKTKKTIHDI